MSKCDIQWKFLDQKIHLRQPPTKYRQTEHPELLDSCNTPVSTVSFKISTSGSEKKLCGNKKLRKPENQKPATFELCVVLTTQNFNWFSLADLSTQAKDLLTRYHVTLVYRNNDGLEACNANAVSENRITTGRPHKLCDRL